MRESNGNEGAILGKTRERLREQAEMAGLKGKLEITAKKTTKSNEEQAITSKEKDKSNK